MKTPQYKNHLRHYRKLKKLSLRDVSLRSKKYLFSIDISHQSSLDSENVNSVLSDCFFQNGYPLSECPKIKRKRTGERWIIQDSPRYLLIKNNNKIDVRYAGVHTMTIHRVETRQIPNPHPNTRLSIAIGLGDSSNKIFL